MLRSLWSDEAGFVVSSELILIATVLVVGLLVGLATVREQVVQELADVAAAISDTNQSYSFSAITGHHSSSAGSFIDDTMDDCDAITNDPVGDSAMCINLFQDASGE